MYEFKLVIALLFGGIVLFTGLIQDVGTVVASQLFQESSRLTLLSHLPLSRFELGASIACNGACLTVIEFSAHPQGTLFSVELGPQTLALTRFSYVKAGDVVNLELALRVGDPLGGHEVTGHVDALCPVLELSELKEGFWRLRIGAEPHFRKWLLLKGSVAICGVSLTVASLQFSNTAVEPGEFEIMLVPHTIHNTALSNLRAGEQVEVEFDQKVKAIASLLEIMLPQFLSKI